MLRSYFAKRRIRKFLTLMPRTLFRDYGRFDEYTQGQVETAARKLGYEDRDLIEVAVGIYCDAEAAKAFGIDEPLRKRYKGYSQQYSVSVDQVVGSSGIDVSGSSD